MKGHQRLTNLFYLIPVFLVLKNNDFFKVMISISEARIGGTIILTFCFSIVGLYHNLVTGVVNVNSNFA